jgi:membrane fusion protein, copper/silver efflux system
MSTLMINILQKIWSSRQKAVVAVLLLLAFSAGYRVRGGGDAGSVSAEKPLVEAEGASAEKGEKRVYICPMVCVPPVDKSGKCPICGMDLTELAAGGEGSETWPVRLELSAESVRLAEIQVAPVEEKFVAAEIRLFGKIDYDPVEQFKVTAFAPGVIDRIYVKRAGQAVRRGDALFDIQSPELYFLEQEAIEILKELPYESMLRPSKGQAFERWMRPPWLRSFAPSEDGSEVDPQQKAAWEKLERVRRKMQLLGLTEDAIDLVIARGQPTGISTVTTPTTGIVLEQNAFRGAFVNTGDTIFTIANPSYTWVNLDAYETDFAWLRLGQEAEFTVDAYPGEKFTGKVINLNPQFDPKTRTFSVGVLYQDPKARLKPNMLARCVIRATMTAEGVGMPGKEASQQPPLLVPESAPLITGERAVVYVADPHKSGVYEGREIQLGSKAKGYYIVKAGLKKGEYVVVNGNFKIDSAVQILAKSSMMSIEDGHSAVAHHHHGGSEFMESSVAMEQTDREERSSMVEEHERTGRNALRGGQSLRPQRLAPGRMSTNAPQEN